MLGAGAVITALRGCGRDALSPEAAVAAAALTGTPDVAGAVAAGASGRELSDEGFAEDVVIATELDVSAVVPVLVDGCFTAAETSA